MNTFGGFLLSLMEVLFHLLQAREYKHDDGRPKASSIERGQIKVPSLGEGEPQCTKIPKKSRSFWLEY